MALSSVALCSRALLKLGAAPITGFDDGTVEAEIASALYPSVRDSLLSAYPWSFATAQVELPQLELAPIADYQFAYQLPDDFLRALSSGSGGLGRGLEYRIARDALHSDASSLVLTYIFRPDELEWPPYFDQILITRLAAEFCLPITESASRAELLYKLADEEFRRGKQIDSQQDTPARIDDYTLINVRS